MRRIVIESPFAGDEAENLAYARRAMAHAIGEGDAPYASHLLYTQVLNDADPNERLVGMQAGFMWAAQAELCAVYVDKGLSEGMREGIRVALNRQIPIEFRSLACHEGTVVADYEGQRHKVALFTEWKPWTSSPNQLPLDLPPVVHQWAMGSLESVCGIRPRGYSPHFHVTATTSRQGVTCAACLRKTA